MNGLRSSLNGMVEDNARDFAFAHHPGGKDFFVMKKTTYCKSIPSISYTTAMSELVRLIGIYRRSTGKAADRAYDDAIVQARHAAHANAYSRLRGAGVPDAAAKSEDIAQTVVLKMLSGLLAGKLRVAAIRVSPANISGLFGRVIRWRIMDAMRSELRGPRFVSSLAQGAEEDKLIDLIESFEAPCLMPSETMATLESLRSRLEPEQAAWDSSKHAAKVRARAHVSDWSPVGEVLGRFDESDRPHKKILPIRTRQRSLKEARDSLRPCL